MSGSINASSSSSPITYPIAKLFPKESYKNAGKEFALHFLIALQQPFKEIQKWIEKVKAEPKNLLNYSDEARYFKLTPLSVCVIVRDKKTAALLIKEGADPKIADIKGWTSFHHAAVINDQKMLRLLKTAQGVDQIVLKSLRDQNGGNYQDLTALLNSKISKPTKKVFYCRQEDGKIKRLTAANFRQHTGALYCKTVVVTPSNLIDQWLDLEIVDESYPQSQEFLQSIYEEYLSQPPRIYLGKDQGFDSYGWDVYVDQDVQLFQGITLYGGEFKAHSSNETNSVYLLENIDGKRIRNLGPMINDGFPNCMYIPIRYHGFEYYLFIAIRKIEKGEKLLWNYGVGHTVKWDTPHLEINPIELETYVRDNSLIERFRSLSTFFASLSHRNVDPQTLLHHLSEREKLSYLLDTPSSMLYLLSKNLFPAQDVCTILCEEPEQLEAVLDVSEQRKLLYLSAKFDKIQKILNNYSEQKQDTLIQEIQQLLLNWSKKVPAAVINNISLFFTNSLDKIQSLTDWQFFKADLEDYVKFMECLVKYCSSDMTDTDFEATLTQIFKNLAKEKQKQALEDLESCVEDYPPKRSMVEAMHKKLSTIQ